LAIFAEKQDSDVAPPAISKILVKTVFVVEKTRKFSASLINNGNCLAFVKFGLKSAPKN